MTTEEDEFYVFSEEQMMAVNEGLHQLNNGMFISNEESNNQAAEILKAIIG